MTKKIRWTTRSIIDRTNIYKYWLERNQSDSYPEKPERLFEKSAQLIANFPNIGTRTDYRNVYSKVVGDYNTFYRIITMKFKSLEFGIRDNILTQLDYKTSVPTMIRIVERPPFPPCCAWWSSIG